MGGFIEPLTYLYVCTLSTLLCSSLYCVLPVVDGGRLCDFSSFTPCENVNRPECYGRA